MRGRAALRAHGGVRSGRSALRAARNPQHCPRCRLHAEAFDLIAAVHLQLATPDADEHAHQVAYVAWTQSAWRRGDRDLEVLRWAFAVGNGGLRSRFGAMRLRAEGVTAGVPDVVVPVPGQRAGFGRGLLIEMKRPAEAVNGIGSIKRDQRDWLFGLAELGWSANVCFSAPAAIFATLDFLRTAFPPGTTRENVGGPNWRWHANDLGAVRSEEWRRPGAIMPVTLWKPWTEKPARTRRGHVGAPLAADLQEDRT